MVMDSATGQNQTAQLKVNLEQLSIANQSHKTAIENLPKLMVELKKLNPRIISRVRANGSLKTTSHMLVPLVGHSCPVYTKLKVVFEDKFDKRIFYHAVQRGAKVHDKGGFLKYKCPTCRYRTWSFNGMARHHFSIHGFKHNYTFTCPDCNFTTRRESALKRHQQRHKDKPDLACPHCPYISRFDVALRVHLRKWHLPDKEAKALKCTDCNFVSICKTTYDAHIMVHINGGENRLSRFLHKSTTSKETEVLKCEYCKFRTPDKNGLRRHMEETHKIKDPFKKQHYQCKICGFRTRHKFSFRDHSLIHKNVEEESLLQCFDCGFKTKWRKYLTVHMRTDHPRPNPKEKVYFHCAECKRKFVTKTRLKDHIFKQHKNADLLMCSECNYTTKTMAVLKSHTLVRHILKKIHRCRKCSHKTKDKKKHRAHLRTHKYECYKCGFETLSKNALRYHIVGHMDKKEIKKVVEMRKCQCCDYESRNKHHYERHMKRWNHYPENPIKNEENILDKPLENKVTYFGNSLKNKDHAYPVDKAAEDSVC